MAATPPTAHDFGTDKSRIRARARKKAKAGRVPGTRPVLPVVVYDAAPGSPGAALPPVRIFMGSEPLQYRAERVFLYSVARHRDPGRRYEVHLMKDIAGYDRKGWATGFTNYRYLIPHLAGGAGRAIYNDVDQVYLGDPAELFDRDMGDAALLAIDDEETSVMLMDCGKLATLWSQDGGPGTTPPPGSRESVHEAGLWGTMSGIWNARDTEYVAGESRLLHFTTLYKQPWQPFPDVYDYAENENAYVWHDLEAEANAAGYFAHTREAPSEGYGDAIRRGVPAAQGRGDAGFVAAQLASSGAKTVLDYGAGRGAAYEGEGRTGRHRADWPGVDVTLHDPRHEPFAADPSGPFDAVVTSGMLEHLPEEDIPWMLDDMFRRARRLVLVDVACHPSASDDGTAPRTVLPPEWWRGQMAMVGAMHPHVGWHLRVATRPDEGGLKGMLRSVFAAPERFSHVAPPAA